MFSQLVVLCIWSVNLTTFQLLAFWELVWSHDHAYSLVQHYSQHANIWEIAQLTNANIWELAQLTVANLLQTIKLTYMEITANIGGLWDLNSCI